MRRRQMLAWGAAASALAVSGAGAQTPVYIGDMHSHLYLEGATIPVTGPLGDNMRAAQATLVSWAFVNDGRWIRRGPQGISQQAVPAPGQLFPYFNQGMARMKAHLAEQKIKLALTPADVALAVSGDPHVVLSSEGGDFLEGELPRLAAAHALGIRHVQLVHYIRNPIGDFQTESPVHNGLTEFGKQVVAECNRLGILVDLAHCTEEAVEHALEISTVPMIWSHSSIALVRTHWTQGGYRSRQLSQAAARKIAGKGGVIGLWALATNVGRSAEAYAETLLRMADTVGVEHVAFGTDLNGMGNGAMMDDYRDLRRVVDVLQSRNLPDGALAKIAIGNYARALTAAMSARKA